jgi:cytochrome bd-type quinol oxidase subunit 1
MRTAFYRIYDSLSEYLSSTDWAGSFFSLKVISLIISVILLIIIIFLIFQIRKDIKKFLVTLAESIAVSDSPEKVSIEGWQSVLDKLESGDEANYKLAVIEADKIFDDLLKRIGYQGKDMGERLKQIAPAQLANIDEVWQAHKLRNRVVHEPDFQLKQYEARRAIEIYQKALEDLEAL